MKRITTNPKRTIGPALLSLGIAWATLFFAPRAFGEDRVPDQTHDPALSWAERYEQARRLLIAGKFKEAEDAFTALAGDATTDPERRLAVEMARIAASWALSDTTIRPSRTRDEITLLYTTSFLYGAGTGTWFLLHTRPDTALTATLPFVGITAAPVITLALVDGYTRLPHGVPHGISVGIFVGLGDSILISAYQNARARRVYADIADSKRWSVETVSTVLWTGATLGGIAGGMLTSVRPTTPGRVSYTGSLALWGGVVAGFATGAVLPDNAYRTENALLAAGIGYNAGLIGGTLSSPVVSPSVTRVRLVDLSGVAGGIVLGGTYLAFSRDPDPRAAMALAGGGTAVGLAIGWFATRGLPKEIAVGAKASPFFVQPTLSPVPGGGVIGLAGAM